MFHVRVITRSIYSMLCSRFKNSFTVVASGKEQLAIGDFHFTAEHTNK